MSSTSSGGAGCEGRSRWHWRLRFHPTFPLYNEILITAFGVVVFSVVVQGLTMPLLLWKLGLLPKKLVAAAMSAR